MNRLELEEKVAEDHEEVRVTRNAGGRTLHQSKRAEEESELRTLWYRGQASADLLENSDLPEAAADDRSDFSRGEKRGSVLKSDDVPFIPLAVSGGRGRDDQHTRKNKSSP